MTAAESLDMKYSPHFIRATAATADLLAAAEAFEAVECAFGVVANAFVRAKIRNPHLDVFEVRGTEFQAPYLRDCLLILSHVAKPSDTNPDLPTLRPFAELLVQHGLTQARLVSPNTWTAWVEVRAEGKPWRKLRPTEKPPVAAPPTTVLDAAMPPEDADD